MTAYHVVWDNVPLFLHSVADTAIRLFRTIADIDDADCLLIQLPENLETIPQLHVHSPSHRLAWLDDSTFADLHKKASLDAQADPRYSYQYPDEAYAAANQKKLFHQALKAEVTARLDEHPDKPSDLQFFVAPPTNSFGHFACVVLFLTVASSHEHHCLQTKEVTVGEDLIYNVRTSLVDAVAQELFECANQELGKQNPDIILFASIPPMLRRAGQRLAEGALWRVHGTTAGPASDLFDTCCSLSTLRYEGAVGEGRLVLASTSHNALRSEVSLVEPIELRDLRGVRKLLELSSETMVLHCDGTNVFGLVGLDEYDAEGEDLYVVHIEGDRRWSLSHDNKLLMNVRDGIPSLPAANSVEEELRKALSQAFGNLDDEKVEMITALVQAASEETSGTMVVVSLAAAEEAERLSSQGNCIVPRKVDKEMLKHLTPIDGALLFDPDGVLHGIGMILDGQATTEGDRSRGARYNSAVRYINANRGVRTAVAAVVSEDGGTVVVV
ncbi:MAG: diadenylate cyclase [Chloroflexota bacterium]|nr:diadenylate cyclase [Chloroflexota bacterium]MDE2894197.1 diadenylate cyclase [Chloroflexota bacterium]